MTTMQKYRPARLVRRYGKRAGLSALAVLLIICGYSDLPVHAKQQAADATTIKIANFTFDPPDLTIKAGTTVTWVNADDIPHVVLEKAGAFRSAALDTGDKFAQLFKTPGTIEYFCALHPHMTGRITVMP